jgi:hypothetical protein
MPESSDCPCVVVTTKNGYIRSNNSWVLSRVLRDLDHWMDASVRTKLDVMLSDRHNYMKSHTKPGTPVPKPEKTGLCIAVYEPCRSRRAGSPVHDKLYWSGFLVALLQLSVAAIPFITHQDWSTLAITASGIILAFLSGALPQWRREKWFSRRNSTNHYILTRGNGAQYAIMILGNGHGLNLEDLAFGTENLDTVSSGWRPRSYLFGLGCLWIALLVAAAGLSQPSWYLLIVGGIGMLHNLAVAGWRRNPSALGIHLVFSKVVGHMSTMDALLELESCYGNAGRCLLPIFFPGALLPHEVAQWDALKAKFEKEKAIKNEAIKAGEAPPEQILPTSWIVHAKSSEGINSL